MPWGRDVKLHAFVVPRLIAVQWPSTAPSRFMDVSFIVLANHHNLSPVTGFSPFAAQLDPWCWTLLWPDCT